MQKSADIISARSGAMEVAGIEPAGAEAELPCGNSAWRRHESALPRIHNTARLVLGSLLPSDRERRSCAEALPGFGDLRAHSPDTGLTVAQDAFDFHRSRRRTRGTNSAAQPRTEFAMGAEAVCPSLRQMERRDCARCSLVVKSVAVSLWRENATVPLRSSETCAARVSTPAGEAGESNRAERVGVASCGRFLLASWVVRP